MRVPEPSVFVVKLGLCVLGLPLFVRFSEWSGAQAGLHGAGRSVRPSVLPVPCGAGRSSSAPAPHWERTEAKDAGPAGSARLSQQGAPHAAGDHSLLGWGQGCGAVRVKPGQVRPSGDQAPPLPGLRITGPVSTPFPPPCSVEGFVGPSGYVCSLGSSCWRQPLFSEGKRQDSRDARSSSRLSPALSAVAERDRDGGDKDEGVGAGLGRGAGSSSCHFYYCHHHRHHWGEVKYSKVINWANPGPGPEEAPQLSLGEEGPRESILGDVHPSSTCMADWGSPGSHSHGCRQGGGAGRAVGGASAESESMGHQWSKQPAHGGEKF